MTRSPGETGLCRKESRVTSASWVGDGGDLTLSAITQFPAKWQAAVSFCGFANLVTAYESARPDMRAFQERNIGTPDQHPDFYRERSPVNYVDRIACPLLLVQGERDPRVLRQETEQMAEALRRAGRHSSVCCTRMRATVLSTSSIRSMPSIGSLGSSRSTLETDVGGAAHHGLQDSS